MEKAVNNMKKILAVLLVCVPSLAHAQGFSSYWNHNGSIVGLAAHGNQRAFVYVEPRPGMAELGVQGTSVFEGATSLGTYQGTAFVFSVCPPYKFGYPVSGPVSLDQLHVVVFGQAPVIDPTSCQVVGYRPDELHFDYVGR